MWINKAEYERLKNFEKMNDQLEEEVKRLAELVSANVTNCHVGVWCEDCCHVGYDMAKRIRWDANGPYIQEIRGQVQYCKKHIHDLCPEFERKQ